MVAFQKQPPEVFYNKSVFRNLAKFTGKHMYERLVFKKETLVQVFTCECCEISKNTFFTEHLRTTASGFDFTILSADYYKECKVLLTYQQQQGRLCYKINIYDYIIEILLAVQDKFFKFECSHFSFKWIIDVIKCYVYSHMNWSCSFNFLATFE